jgi:hypothetical protein
MSAVRSVAILVAACAAAAMLAACTANAPASVNPPSAHKAPVTPTAPVAVSSASTSQATVAPATSAPAATASAQPPATSSAPSAPASAAAVTTDGCRTMSNSLAGASITVCPDQAPLGSTVQITIKGCAGSEDLPAAGLFFLGPNSWLGTNGGGGRNVPYSPVTRSREATATFVIPATYTGGNEKGGSYPTLPTRPGRYAFVTDPAGECNVPFTVTPA